MNHGQRVIHKCNKYERLFKSTFNTFLAGIRKPISLIIQVIISRPEGLGFNAACSIFEMNLFHYAGDHELDTYQEFLFDYE